MRVVIPYLLLALASAIPALLGMKAGRAHGYYTLALINVALYMTAAISILVLHIYEHPRELRLGVVRSSVDKIAATATSGTIVLAAAIAPGFVLAPRAVSAAAPEPPAAAAPPPLTDPSVSSLALGVTTDALAKNSTRPWTTNDLAQVNAFEQTAHAHLKIVMWYADWTHAVNRPQLRAVARRHSVPEITWEPWNYAQGLRRSQPQYTLASIIHGHHDAYVRAWARELRAYGGPVLLRFAQEMNGNWYPWGKTNGNLPGQFVLAWRHVHNIFAAEHVHNVSWIWSPVARFAVPIDLGQYPGNNYVDVLGLTGFNGGTAAFGIGWHSFSSLFDPALGTLRRFAPNKPIQISEVGSAERGGNKAAWIAAMFADLRRHPQVTSILWFNLRKQADWRITSSRRAAVAFATGSSTRTGATARARGRVTHN
jgi:beta-mannanase